MNKLVMMVAACLVGATVFGAQCEGKTQKGERCKREAAEGSKYCIGHAEQTPKAPAGKLALSFLKGLQFNGGCVCPNDKFLRRD